jgi:hypothetical protein
MAKIMRVVDPFLYEEFIAYMRNKTEKEFSSPPADGKVVENSDLIVSNVCCAGNNVCSNLVESPAIEPLSEIENKEEESSASYLPKVNEISPSNVSSPEVMEEENTNWLRLEELKYVPPYIRFQETRKRPRK